MFLQHSMRVRDLIDTTTRSFKKELLSNLFLPRDVDEILGVYFLAQSHKTMFLYGIMNRMDCLQFDRHTNGNGIYGKRHHNGAGRRKREGSNSNLKSSLWSKFWNVTITPKAKLLGWKICNDVFLLEIIYGGGAYWLNLTVLGVIWKLKTVGMCSLIAHG